jgi:SAM-dependent methyltransferase
LNEFIQYVKQKYTRESKGKVLEIGFGATTSTKRYVEKTRVMTWYGIDPRWGDHPERGIYKGTACHLPFENEFFDVVISSNTMEHWAEFGEDADDGLNEIWRVMKKGGLFLTIVPMESHGSAVFKNGDVGKVEFMFRNWHVTKFEQWKNDLDTTNKEYMLSVEAIK